MNYRTARYRMRLFVAGCDPNSERARKNIKSLVFRRLNDPVDLWFVNVLEDSSAAFEEGLLFVPALVIDGPIRQKIYGRLDDETLVRDLLTGKAEAPAADEGELGRLLRQGKVDAVLFNDRYRGLHSEKKQPFPRESARNKIVKVTAEEDIPENPDINIIDKNRDKKSSDSDGAPDQEKRIGILIVDDHKVLREGLKGILAIEPDFHVLGDAADGDTAIKLAKSLNPDVIIMDINLGEMDGVVVTQKILSEQPKIHVIGLSMHNEPEVVDAMYNAGAAGFLDKSIPSQELIDTIRNCSNNN